MKFPVSLRKRTIWTRWLRSSKKMIPELLEANGVAYGEDVPFEILGKRFAVAHREAA